MVLGLTFSFGTLVSDGWEVDVTEREGVFTDISWNFDSFGDDDCEEDRARRKHLNKTMKELSKKFVPDETDIGVVLKMVHAFFVLEELD